MAYQYITKYSDPETALKIFFDYCGAVDENRLRQMYISNRWTEELDPSPVLFKDTDWETDAESPHLIWEIDGRSADDKYITNTTEPMTWTVKDFDPSEWERCCWYFSTNPNYPIEVGNDEADNKAFINVAALDSYGIFFAGRKKDSSTLVQKLTNADYITSGAGYYEEHRSGGVVVTSDFSLYGHPMAISPVRFLTKNYPTAEFHYKVTVNMKVFTSWNKAKQYLNEGIDDDDMTKPKKPAEKKPSDKYIYSTIKQNTLPVKAGAQLFQENDLIVKYNSNVTKRWGGSRPVAGWVDDGGQYNIHIKVNPDAEILGCREKLNTTSWTDLRSFDDVTNYKWHYDEFTQGQSYYYYGRNRRNIPLFKTEQEVDDYFNGLNPKELPGGEGKYPGKDDEGEDLEQSEYNLIGSSTPLTSYYSLSLSQLGHMANVIYTDRFITTIEDLQKALGMFGENPISFLIDHFMIPFDPQTFCELTYSSNIGYGRYYDTVSESWAIISKTNKMATMFTHYFNGLFNDFRDYAQQFYLYLPYVGFVNLDVRQWMYHQMTCKVACDVKVGALKYYLECDGKLVETYEGSVRMSFPLMGSDSYAGAMNELAGAGKVLSGAATVAIGAGSMIAGAQGTSMAAAEGNPETDKVARSLDGLDLATKEELTGSGSMSSFDVRNMTSNAQSFAGGLGDIAQGVIQMAQASPKSVSGNQSNSLAIFDQPYAYLIIQQQEYEAPALLEQYYGIPDSDVNVIGAYRGYVQTDNVQLKTSATDAEINEMLNILRGGIII